MITHGAEHAEQNESWSKYENNKHEEGGVWSCAVRSPILTNASEMVDGIKPETNKRAAAGDEVLARHQSNHVAASRTSDVTRPALTASGRL